MTAVQVAEPALGPPAAEPAVRWRLAGYTVVAVLLGLLVGWVGSRPQPLVALLVPLVFVPFVLWLRPALCVFVVLGAAVGIEQFGYEVGPRSGTVTSQLPFFHSVSVGSGVLPVEVLLLLTLVLCAARAVLDGSLLDRLPRTAFSGRLILFLAITVGYLLFGISRGAAPREAIGEVRPFLYLAATYLLAYALLRTTQALHVVLWMLVVGCAAKATYGVWIWTTIRHVDPRPEAVLAHEESFFFGLYLLLVLGLWLFGLRGRLRVVATVLLPVVLLGDLVNSRRTAWAIFICGALTMIAVAYVALPARRALIRVSALVASVFLVAYLPVFWSKEGTFAQPARAVRSVIAPDARDEASNKYRQIEDANLSLNIQATHSTGTGFGLPIDYAIPIVDLSSTNSLISFVPHDGVLWIWMRLGLLGQIAFWLVLAEAVVGACRLARGGVGEVALLGALVASAVVAYAVMGNKDYGFYWFRMACCLGVLLGLVERHLRDVDLGALRRLAAARPAAGRESRVG